jgi:C_GCAxxG_C_C family probable redox protein
MNMDETVELAKQYAADGFLCSEAVLKAASQWLGVESILIPRIATGFGAGIGGCGSICGALSGGVMALGLRFGRNDPARKEGRKPYDFAAELLNRFESKYGCITCRELTLCDLKSEAGRQKYVDEKIWVIRCRDYIGSVTQMVLDQISAGDKSSSPALVLPQNNASH